MRVLAIAFFLFMQPVGVDQIQNWYQSGRYQEIVDQGQQASPMGMYLLASASRSSIDSRRREPFISSSSGAVSPTRGRR